MIACVAFLVHYHEIHSRHVSGSLSCVDKDSTDFGHHNYSYHNELK